MSVQYDPDRIRQRLLAVRFDGIFRLVHANACSRGFEVVPAPSRFGDPEQNYGVLYAAETITCGFWEAIVRNRLNHNRRRELPRGDIESTLVVSLSSASSLVLTDLRGDGPLRLSAPPAVTHDANHAAGRALSAATYANVPEADGFLWTSRFTGDICVAVFDRATVKLEASDVTSLIECKGFFDMLDDYKIKLVD